mgnify:CR=1 FL=1
MNDIDTRAVKMLSSLDGLDPKNARICVLRVLTLFVQIECKREDNPKELIGKIREMINVALDLLILRVQQ